MALSSILSVIQMIFWRRTTYVIGQKKLRQLLARSSARVATRVNLLLLEVKGRDFNVGAQPRQSSLTVPTLNDMDCSTHWLHQLVCACRAGNMLQTRTAFRSAYGSLIGGLLVFGSLRSVPSRELMREPSGSSSLLPFSILKLPSTDYQSHQNRFLSDTVNT